MKDKDRVILYKCGTHWGEHTCCDKATPWVATPLYNPPIVGGYIDTEIPPGKVTPPPAPEGEAKGTPPTYFCRCCGVEHLNTPQSRRAHASGGEEKP